MCVVILPAVPLQRKPDQSVCLFRIKTSDFFIGPQIDINYDHITDPAKHLIEQAATKQPEVLPMGIKVSAQVSASSLHMIRVIFLPIHIKDFTLISGE